MVDIPFRERKSKTKNKPQRRKLLGSHKWDE